MAALAGASPAAAAVPAPICTGTALWARPELTRHHVIDCEFAESAAVAEPPRHGELFALSTYREEVWFASTPAAGAPAQDSLELRVTGPGGEVVVPVAINVVPRTRNTPPSCAPISAVERTDGAGPVTFMDLEPSCADAEHDELTLHGGGPGGFQAPYRLTGGGTAYRVPGWSYRTAAAAGIEHAVFWAVDELGERSADVPATFAFGPAADRPVQCSAVPGHRDVHARPGVVRNFSVECVDRDGDPFGVRLGSLPQRGTLTFAPSTEPDAFSVIADTAAGPVEFALRIVAAAPWRDTPNSCPWGSRWSAFRQLELELHCHDLEGDPPRVEITTPPGHGVAAPPVLGERRQGNQAVTIRSTPPERFAGEERLGVSIDGEAEQLVPLHIPGWATGQLPAPAEPPRCPGASETPCWRAPRWACGRCGSYGGSASRGLSTRRSGASRASAGDRRSRSRTRGAAASMRVPAPPRAGGSSSGLAASA